MFYGLNSLMLLICGQEIALYRNNWDCFRFGQLDNRTLAYCFCFEHKLQEIQTIVKVLIRHTHAYTFTHTHSIFYRERETHTNSFFTHSFTNILSFFISLAQVPQYPHSNTQIHTFTDMDTLSFTHRFSLSHTFSLSLSLSPFLLSPTTGNDSSICSSFG